MNYFTHETKLEIQGVFPDTKDSAFYIERQKAWHVTFVKIDNVIYEELRRIDLVGG